MSLQLLNLGSGPDDGTGDTGRAGGEKINANFTELYTFAPSAALLVNGSVDGTDQLFAGHVGVGDLASVSDLIALNCGATVTTTGAGQTPSGLNSGVTVKGGHVATQPAGVDLPMIIDGVGAFSTSVGIRSVSTVGANQGAVDLLGINGFTSLMKSDAGHSGSLGNCVHYQVNKGVYNGGNPTTETGISVANLGQAGLSTVNGIQITKQAGATNNYGIFLNGDDLGADITFGAGQDVRQHFNGTNLEFEGSGISHTASTVTHDGYVTIAINGVAYNFMTGS
jgi:hypothetical protein